MGILSEEQVGRVVAVSVAVVNSSLSEGMSQSILEVFGGVVVRGRHFLKRFCCSTLVRSSRELTLF